MVAGPGALAARAAPLRAPSQNTGQRGGGQRGARGGPVGYSPASRGSRSSHAGCVRRTSTLTVRGGGRGAALPRHGEQRGPPSLYSTSPPTPPARFIPPPRCPSPVLSPPRRGAPPLPCAASRCAPTAPTSAVPRGWGRGCGGSTGSGARPYASAAAAGTESGPTGRMVVAGGGRRLHNSPVAARRFLRGEVRAARPAPLPGIGPSAAGGERWRSGEPGGRGGLARGGGENPQEALRDGRC